jgi:hypothetical protein
MRPWLGVVLLLGCSRGGVDGDPDGKDLAPVGEVEDLAGADLLGADLSGAPSDLAGAADLRAGAPSELDCYYDWRTRMGCPPPELTDSYLAQGCVGTTGVFVVGRYFQHGNQYESMNGWMPHGPYASPKLNRNTWNWLTPRLACLTTSNDATYWTGFEIQLKNPDGQLSNKVTVQNRIGGRPALPTTGSSDPFDPNACFDPVITMAQALAKFPVAASSTTLGNLTIRRRSRPCNALTGCAGWGPASTEATVAAKLQISGNVHFALDTTDCGSLGTSDTSIVTNSCTAMGAAQSYNLHISNSCLMLWQTARTAIAGDGSYTQTDYGAVLRY